MSAEKNLSQAEFAKVNLDRGLAAFEYRLPKLPSLKVLWNFAWELSRDEEAARRERREASLNSLEPR